jgi:ceramide glucosyltransferase
MELPLVAAMISAGLVGLNVLSVLLAATMLRSRYRIAAFPDSEGISIVRPVCGVEPFIEETLLSGFRLDHPNYEILFCVADHRDPVVPIILRLIEDHPSVKARLLTGEDRISDNPKLNNCLKGWRAAAHRWIVLADSNVLMPEDYLQHLATAWRPDSGLVCATPVASRVIGFWAEVECAFLNTHQARWQYAGAGVGLGFAQGKSMLWDRAILERHGGLQALASDLAEDAAATKLVRSAGLHVHLAQAPFEQPLGYRTLREVCKRQIRWARLRRVSFPLYFAPEIASGAPVPVFAALLATGMHLDVASASALLVVVSLYGMEAALAGSKGWHLTWRFPLACLARDVIFVPIWLYAWFGKSVVWRGNPVTIEARISRPVQEWGSTA